MARTKPMTDHVGEFSGLRWRSPEEGNNFCIGMLADKTCVLGPAEEGELIPGLVYQFFGYWEENAKHGKQFKFSQFVRREPHSRHGLVRYLEKYAPGIGLRRAGRLYDAFGSEAVKVLRTQPEAAAKACGLSVDEAHKAAAALQKLVALEDTKIQLTNLFSGRGFPGALTEACVQKWGILAPARIQRDPFCLLVEELPGCGFARCDQLYSDLGLPLGRLKRQMVVLWHAVKSDSSGDTWLPESRVVQLLGQAISGCPLKPVKAIKLGLRARWLARRVDAQGQGWLAVREHAENEAFVAAKIAAIEAESLPHEAYLEPANA